MTNMRLRRQCPDSEPQLTREISTSIENSDAEPPEYQEQTIPIPTIDEKQPTSSTHEILLIPAETDWYRAISAQEPHPYSRSSKTVTYAPKDPISALLLATTETATGVLGGTADLTGLNPAPEPKISKLKGIPRILDTAIHIPRDYTLALAEGFREGPALYGDTVRPAPEITGFGSGLSAAGKGLGLGLYDGLTGFVLKPISGAKKEGVIGFGKGFGKGVGGLVLNPCAGACGVAGYMLEGVHVEARKLSIASKRMVRTRTRRQEVVLEDGERGFY